MNVPDYKAQRDNLLAFCQNAQVSSGVCCCGDDMSKHSNEHSPVDQWDYSVDCFRREFHESDKAYAAAPAPAVVQAEVSHGALDLVAAFEDAERYRWIVANDAQNGVTLCVINDWSDEYPNLGSVDSLESKADYDKAIDAARGAQ